VTRPRGVPLGFWYRFVAVVLRPLLMLLTRRDWRGTEHVPATGGLVVCANHVSYLDPLTLAHFLWDNGRVARFLAKAGVFRIPVVGRIIAACGQSPVHRDSRDAARAYRDGRGAFPERAALNQLTGRFLTELYATVARWVHWASEVVYEWPDDVTQAPFDVAAADEGVRLAESVAKLLGQPVRPPEA
jgi:1-acyl-sn-glycerol-3-phosphate acyltransferase